MTADLVTRLIRILNSQTSTPERCWFAVWTGFALAKSLQGLPRLVIPHREYYVAQGPIEDALRGLHGPGLVYQSPNMWWPEDRSWFVSTEVDLPYTYGNDRMRDGASFRAGNRDLASRANRQDHLG